MMRDNLDPHVSGHDEPAKRHDEDEAVSDREVPLSAGGTPEIIHRWLDGERVDEKQLEAAGGYTFWRRLKAETDRRRRMQTPSPVSGAIMQAIRKDA